MNFFVIWMENVVKWNKREEEEKLKEKTKEKVEKIMRQLVLKKQTLCFYVSGIRF